MTHPERQQRRPENLWDAEHGCCVPGVYDKGQHIGRPLTVAEIQALPEGAEITVSWSGGNGPHPYRVTIDEAGRRCTTNIYRDTILTWEDQKNPLHRVTLGWTPEFRRRMEERDRMEAESA